MQIHLSKLALGIYPPTYKRTLVQLDRRYRQVVQKEYCSGNTESILLCILHNLQTFHILACDHVPFAALARDILSLYLLYALMRFT